MRTLLVSVCCLSLAGVLGAAQPPPDQDQNGPKGKKKGGNNYQVQPTVAPTGKFKGQAHYNANPNFNKKKNWQGPVTGGNANVSGQINTPAKNTTFNKTTNINKNLTVNKNYKFQKKQFNLQTNNKQFIINKYKTVNYNANYKIAGAYKWKGPQYQVFVNYHPIWHDAWWYNSYHPHVVFIFGGWYYWDNNYWYPAWGYAPDSVYVFDGPIYASSPAEDPAQVVANVQSALQEQGYYQGDIDGVLGPQTRAALAEYQSAQGIEPTGVVDEPTLETLGMA